MLMQEQARFRVTRRPRRKDNEALKNVISLRVTDDELADLTRQSRETAKSISELIREALQLRGPAGEGALSAE